MNALAAVPPFLYTQRYRYFQGWRVVSYLLGELLPVAVFVALRSDRPDWVAFALAWAFFWGFYEIGYLFNDCRSVHGETMPSHRAPANLCSRLSLVVALRLAYLGPLAWLLRGRGIELVPVLSLTALIAAAFSLHNHLRSYESRFATLLVLGVAKPLFIPHALGLPATELLVVLLPDLAIKLTDYLHAKGLARYDLRTDRRRVLALLALYAPLVALLEPELLWVYGPLALNRAKGSLRFPRSLAGGDRSRWQTRPAEPARIPETPLDP